MSKAAELAALIGSGQAQGDKNFVINGDMQCWQRATAATTVTNAYATVDRYKFTENTSGAFSSERSTDTPTGTGYSLKLQCTTADTSMAAGDYAYMVQNIEAQNLQSLQYGTSSAKTLTLSFWVKSSKTGTYAIVFSKLDNTVYLFRHEYTISSANTWEKKIITISPTAGSTSFITSAAGAIDNDNGTGCSVFWWLCSGTDLNGGTSNAWSSNTAHYTTTNQVNWFDSTSNNFYLSQVQLEIGEVATPFEHEYFATTLAKCKRYFENLTFPNATVITIGQVYDSNTDASADLRYNVSKRDTPTIGVPSVGRSSGNINFLNANAGFVATSDGTISAVYIGVDSFTLYGNGFNAFSANGDASWVYSYGTNTFTIDAEL